MTSQKPDDHHLRAHPLLSRLLEVGANVRAFRGYVGPEKDSGRVRLYPSLGDLSFSIEINESDIVASAAAPESLLPHSGTVIWVKPDAEVVCYGDRINTVAARRPRQAGALDVSLANVDETQTAASRLVEVQAGRLNIQLRPRVMSSCASCSCSSCETQPELHLDMQPADGQSLSSGRPVSSSELTLVAPTNRESPATYEPVLRFEAPYLIEKLVKDRIVDTADEGEALFAEAKKFLILSYMDSDVSWNMYSTRVDEAWHQFVLFTSQYVDFCHRYFGEYLHHNPSNAPEAPGRPATEAVDVRGVPRPL